MCTMKSSHRLIQPRSRSPMSQWMSFMGNTSQAIALSWLSSLGRLHGHSRGMPRLGKHLVGLAT
jgi:hypothetical protein